MNNKCSAHWVRAACCLLLLCSSAVGCTSLLTQEHGAEMRVAFDQYFTVATGGARYGDSDALREVVTERQLEKELLSADTTIRDTLVRYEIKNLQVCGYAPDSARIRVHWVMWHRNNNIVTGQEGPVTRMEMIKDYDFVKEEGRWKVDGWQVVEQIEPPLP
jgi:hypothetical protein